MSAENRPEGMDPRLDQILKEYLQAVDRGEQPSAEDWISRHAEFAQPLREFLASLKQVNDQVIPAHVAYDAPTLAQSPLPPALNSLAVSAKSALRCFGDYQLESEIARGGMGVVYRARQVSLNRAVAVKMILAGELASPVDVARFRSEAEAAANLDHPAIVPIYEIGEREGQHYFSMKFIDGESLSQRLHKHEGQKRTRRELEQRVDMLISVARGIHYAHQRGIIHRDLKPANILIDSAGQPHITDFGLARRTSHDSQLTNTGAIVGTPSYMAPEQALGSAKSATTAVDIYGLGAILYVALTGRPPFEGSSALATILLVQESSPVVPSKLAPDIDRELEIICLKCLEKDPEARYRSAGELADDLDRWRCGEPIHAVPPNAARMLWRWISAHFQSVACALIIGLVTGLLVCEPAVNALAHDLGGFARIYRGSFPGEEAPWVLKALEAYPCWIGPLAFPLMFFCYFSMGWFTDRLIKPADLAGAILSGLGVGTVAAITAFLVGVGWQTIIQMAVWPSMPDLELLATEISQDATFSNGQTIVTQYPADINGIPINPRYVLKKVLADIQARIPLGLWYGSLFSAGVLLLPATLQTVAAQYLRSRNDHGFWQIVHLLELSVPMSLMLVSLGRVCSVAPQISAMMILLLLAAWIALHSLKPAQIVARRAVLGALAGLGACFLFVGRDAFFTSLGGGFNPSFATAGAIVAALAVTYRFRWWQRLLLYGIWVAVLFLSEGVLFGMRGSSVDSAINAGRALAISASASVVLLGLAAVFTVILRPTQVDDSTAHKPSKA